MTIYRNNTEYFVFDFEPKGREKRQLMEEHSVTLSFELPKYIRFEKGDSVVYNGKTFYLAKDYLSTINKRTGGFIYDLKFLDITERFKDILLKYEMEGVKELDFTITSSGDNLLDIVIESLSQIGTFTKGVAPISVKEFRFQNISVYEALNLIAEQYEMEWWLDEDTLNIGKMEFGTPVILAHDRELDDISFSPSSQEMPTRLYAFGSTKNLPSDYGVSGDTTNAIFENRLRLPDGYIDLFPNLPENQVVEGVKVFDDVFPRQQNEVIEVMETLIGETTIYWFRGDNTFELTQENLISGQALKVAFETGNLAGREFDLIIKGDNRFEIKYQQSGERVIPNKTLKPRPGDKFFFFNFDVASVLPSLVTDAESELASKAQAYLDKLGEEYVYTVRTRSVYCRKNNIDLGMGQVVQFTSPTLGTKTSRVMGYEKDINDVYDCTYEIGDYSKYSRLDELEKMAKSEEWIEGNFKHMFDIGIIDVIERMRLEAYIELMLSEHETLMSRYVAFGLELPEWEDYEQIHFTLKEAINDALERGRVTAEEKRQITLFMNAYREAVSALTAILDAKLVGDIEQLQSNINTTQGNLFELNEAMDKLENETLKAMEDNLISEAERRSLYAIYLRLDIEQEQLLSNVMYALNSIYMPEEHIDELANTANRLLKVGGSLDKFQDAIMAILDQADPIITDHERNVYNKTLAIYKRDYNKLSEALRDSRLAIDAEIKRLSDHKTDTVEGGKNLLRNYDQRWDFDYWGGVGDYLEVDLDTEPLEEIKGLRDQRRLIVDEQNRVIEIV